MRQTDKVSYQALFMRWSAALTATFHKWEVVVPLDAGGELRARTAEFSPKDYDTPEEQYEDVCDFIRGCRFSSTDYFVFCDEKLVTDF